MKYHLTADGTWMRCRAEVRAGRGVTDCPVGEGPHVIGRAGIAALPNGGQESRWEDGDRVVATISPIDTETGTFTVTSHKNKVRVYTADGVHLPHRTRAKEGPGHARGMTVGRRLGTLSCLQTHASWPKLFDS